MQIHILCNTSVHSSQNAGAAMTDGRIVEYIYQFERIAGCECREHHYECRYTGHVGFEPIQMSTNGSYLCSFCWQEIPTTNTTWHYVVELRQYIAGSDTYLVYMRSLHDAWLWGYLQERCYRRCVHQTCFQKFKSYFEEDEYSTWSIRVSDVVALWDQTKVNTILPVLDLWHIVMQYTNPRYQKVEDRRHISRINNPGSYRVLTLFYFAIIIAQKQRRRSYE